MASDDAVNQHTVEKSSDCETTDRGLFDFIKKDDSKDEGKVIAEEFDNKVHVSEPEPKFQECTVETTEQVEEEKVTKPSLLEKLHRSGSSSSSSSSSDEEVEEGGQKKKKKKEKKGLKEKIEEKIHKDEDTSVPVEVATEPEEEKKSFMDKIKDKLPGSGAKKVEEETAPPPPAPVAAVDCTTVEGEPAKKGILEKIKEKIPGYHPKPSVEEEKKEKECA